MISLPKSFASETAYVAAFVEHAAGAARIHEKSAASTTPIQNRRVMSTSSALGPLAAPTLTGSSAMPQIGQTPGPTCRICWCIGQV